MKQYLNRTQLQKYLDILLLIDMILIPSQEDWLRLIKSGVTDDGVLWYIIDNGGGDQLMILFAETGILIKGFDHENELNPFAADEPDENFFSRLFSGIPETLLQLLTDDEREMTTFCMWYLDSTALWYQNETPDNDGGKEWLLDYIHQNADAFLEWANAYYFDDKRSLDRTIIRKLFASGTLTREEILQLHPDCEPDSILKALH